ncbi:alpha/beta hydrolase [Nannocystis sp. SCPEA4]|uniref:alpha/beta hydrolase n=1 Tax=Nannocystis sp. SCPEA4 TaxID=2996787 RepID=UPI002270B6D1|nr:alpha/beta hydrolase [Nannocystis sp. SCPEA4]MCY1055527.1 alpha/beta hydrolase [Nannocystis sp. SCPEA4]
MPRLLVVPRWAGTPRSDYYPWLVDALADAPGRPFAPVIVADLPEPGHPRIHTWPPAIGRLLGDDPAVLADTFVMGHSVGCQALLHALAALPAGARVAGMLAVAGWWRVDDPWPAILPWQDRLPDLARVRATVPSLTVLLSDGDPFTGDYRENAAQWRERLGAEVEVVPGARHFNAAEEPAVLATLLRLAGGLRSSNV